MNLIDRLINRLLDTKPEKPDPCPDCDDSCEHIQVEGVWYHTRSKAYLEALMRKIGDK